MDSLNGAISDPRTYTSATRDEHTFTERICKALAALLSCKFGCIGENEQAELEKKTVRDHIRVIGDLWAGIEWDHCQPLDK